MTAINAISNAIASKRRFLGIRTDILEQFVRVLKEDLKARVGFAIVVIFLFVAIIAPVLSPFDPLSQSFQPFRSPSIFAGTDHPLGTDSYGRDMLSRLIVGARISLAVGVGAVVFGAGVGVLTGLLAGFFGGWVDDVLMRIVDLIWAFPYLIIAIMLVAIFGQGLWNVIFALGIAYIDDFARVTRSKVLSIREEEYILAARSVGMNDAVIIFGEVFPNALAPVIVLFTVLTARAMLGEATLSFLGLGVKPTTPTWGAMMGQGRDFVTTAWWISILPGMLVMITVLGINFVGDALRDAFDVKQV